MAEQELASLLSRKRQVDKNLASLEIQIYQFEASYLEETSAVGNIIKGFDGYLAPAAATSGTLQSTNPAASYAMGAAAGGGAGAGGGGRKRMASTRLDPNSERIFSNSSLTHQKALAMHGIIPDGMEDEVADLDAGALTAGDEYVPARSNNNSSRNRANNNIPGSPMSTSSVGGDAEYAASSSSSRLHNNTSSSNKKKKKKQKIVVADDEDSMDD